MVMAATYSLIASLTQQFSLSVLCARHCLGCLGYTQPCLPGAYILVEETEKNKHDEQFSVLYIEDVDKGKQRAEDRGAGVLVWGLGSG